ncbi:MAG: hypothetical protein SPJ05_02940, partial [Candidatus Limisoma sp.]|nr:hypothetical protein [Candidatus Limisoma sp.]
MLSRRLCKTQPKSITHTHASDAMHRHRIQASTHVPQPCRRYGCGGCAGGTAIVGTELLRYPSSFEMLGCDSRFARESHSVCSVIVHRGAFAVYRGASIVYRVMSASRPSS